MVKSVDVNASLMEIQTGRLIQIIEATEKGQSGEIIKDLVEQLAIKLRILSLYEEKCWKCGRICAGKTGNLG